MSRATKWAWMMSYCRSNMLPAAQNWAWDKAEQAFLNNQSTKEQKKMKKSNKVISVDSCLECPKWMECEPSKNLKGKQRVALHIGVGAPKKFILKGCPLKDGYLEEGVMEILIEFAKVCGLNFDENHPRNREDLKQWMKMRNHD